jgi:pilus assembly protein CpaF
MLRITVTERGGPIRRLEFDKNEISIGRVQGNDIILAKGNVSKRHARIVVEEGKLVLYDLKSTNGTYVNGRRISEPHVLRPADKLYIGDFVLVPEDTDIQVTAQRVSPDVHPEQPIEPEDPLADLARRRRREVVEEVPPEAVPAPPAPQPPRVEPEAPPVRSRPPSPPPLRAEEPAVRRASSAPVTLREPGVSPVSAPHEAPVVAPAPLPRAPMAGAPAPAVSARAAPRAAPSGEYLRQLGLLRESLCAQLDLSRAGIFGEDLRKKVADSAREIIARALEDGRLPSSVDTEQLHRDVVSEVAGFGPLEGLLADREVTEILVNHPSSIYVERGGRLSRAAGAFSSSAALMDVVRRMLGPGRSLPEDEPVVEARLPQGHRLTAVLPPFAPQGPSFILRKAARLSRTLPELIQEGVLSEALGRFLELCVRARRNLVFAGGAGAGKSTLLGATAALVPSQDRLVLVEELAEIVLSRDHLVALEARVAAEDGREAALRELVRAALRLQPEWLVVGDCRGPEVLDLVQAMVGGRDGVFLTVNAHSPREALTRLEAMAQLAAEAPGRGVRESVALACHLVVQVSRYPDGTRRVAQLAEVTGVEGDRPAVKEIFSYVPGEGGGRFVASGYIPRFVDDLTRCGAAVDLSIFRE